MIEKIIVEYLGSKIDSGVYAEIPEKKPESFVVVEKTSGSKVNHIKGAVIAVQAYAGSLFEAAELNEKVKNAMEQMAEDVTDVCLVKLNSDYNYTDTSMKKYRYQAVFDVKYY